VRANCYPVCEASQRFRWDRGRFASTGKAQPSPNVEISVRPERKCTFTWRTGEARRITNDLNCLLRRDPDGGFEVSRHRAEEPRIHHLGRASRGHGARPTISVPGLN